MTSAIATLRLALPLALLLAGCSSVSVPRLPALAPSEPEGAPRNETIVAVTASQALVRFDAGTPRTIAARAQVSGMEPGDGLVGIDWRAARREVIGLGIRGRLYVIDAATGKAAQVLPPDGSTITLAGDEFGFDIDPRSERIRVVSEAGMNVRASPETGLVMDADPATEGIQPDGPLRYAPGDEHEGQAPRLLAIAFDPAGTLFGLDARSGKLVTLGAAAGDPVAISPNSGRLFTVGATGLAEAERIAFDISPSGAGYAALTPGGAKESRLYLIDLASGRARFLGTIAAGEPVRALAVVPK